MIWTKDILFLHVPKTGGMSVTEFLLKNLDGPVSYTSDTRHSGARHAKFIEGSRHETLADAESFFTYKNRSVFDFDAIFAVMRNPYDLEVSRYHYLRQGLKVDRGPAQDLALAGDFREYLRNAAFFGALPPRLDRYFQLGNVIPPNMQILRNEYLDVDLRMRLAPYLVANPTELPRSNTTQHDSWTEYYDDVTEELCYRRHRWFFDLGFYPRLPFAYERATTLPGHPTERSDPSTPNLSSVDQPFPTEIPADLLDTPSGLGFDGLKKRGRITHTRLTEILGVETLAHRRVLDVGGGGALARMLALEGNAVGSYLSLETNGRLRDYLRAEVGDSRLSFGKLSIRGAVASVTGVDDGSPAFDTIWTSKLLQRLPPESITALLLVCRDLATADATLLAPLHLAQRSEDGAANGLFDFMVSLGLPEELHDNDLLGPTESGDYVYALPKITELFESAGWQIVDVRPPIHGSPHVAVARFSSEA